jgi:O-methyltransferase involved in polyketide biosynthesis
MWERFGRIVEQFGVDDTLDVGELTYEDPDRADVAAWLDAHGWRSGWKRGPSGATQPVG